MARSIASITRSTSRCASRLGAKQARVWRSSTAKVAKRLKKGVYARSAGLRCGQEGYGSKAAHPGRHARPLAERCRSSRQHSGSRRRCAGPRPSHAPLVSLYRTHLRRRWLPRAESGCRCCSNGRLGDRHRQAIRQCNRLRDRAKKMDRRTNNRLDQPLPSSRQRFRTLCQNCRSLYPSRHDPHHAAALDQIKSLPLN